MTESGKALYRDAKYLVRYSRDSVERARRAAFDTKRVVRIGTSPMTPGQFLVGLWPKLHGLRSDVKFQLIPFENTPDNAAEILRNLGRDIDVVAGIFDNKFWRSRGCETLELYKAPVRCALPVHHRLASKAALAVQDLYGEDLMLIRREWNSHVDALRDDIQQYHPQINIADFDFYNTGTFNQCENNDYILMTIDYWKDIHPLLRVLPVEWDYTIPFGLLYSPSPTEAARKFLNAVRILLKR